MRVVVTGGSSGIGKECCNLLAGIAEEIVIIDVMEPDINDVAWIKADFTDVDSLDKLEHELAGNFDALINSAGLPPRESNGLDILLVNFMALRKVSEIIIPKMNPGSSLVNLASKAGSNWKESLPQIKQLIPITNLSDLTFFCKQEELNHVRAYDLSKEAVIVWTMASCEGLKKKEIRINSVSPAAIQTRILDDFISAFGERSAQMINRIGRPGTPQEVAEVIMFLISNKSHWITGIDLPVDGGTSAVVNCIKCDLSQLGYK
ncbi:MAG: SDR family oxidoreductase [Rhodobacteraceae bacterium]|nr:SDR family oxidoreductase [Paracoccaceae bacterium]MCY4249359.1 SDR family oxidoreductase [Paracoccaceae bacterium]